MRTRHNKKNKKQTRKRLLNGGASSLQGLVPSSLQGLVPSTYCAPLTNLVPACPPEPLIKNTAPFAKPWLNVSSNILFIGLVVSDSCSLGYKIRELNFALGLQDPYIIPMEETGTKLSWPHISLMNVYVPELGQDSLHNILSSEDHFSYVANSIASIIQSYIIKRPYKKLRSESGVFQKFGNFVVKKFTGGDFDNFIHDRFLPFKNECTNFLLGILPGSTGSVFAQSCCPAYFPRNKSSQIFKHYSNNSTPQTSDFAISNYFEEDLNPHVSLFNSVDEGERDAFIRNISSHDTEDLNELELSPCNISSVFVSYNGLWINVQF